MSMSFGADPGGIIANPRWWESGWGYEYWTLFGNADWVAAMSASNNGGSGYGWTMTALSIVEGASGDFLSSADHTPTYCSLGANLDSLVSPRVFGSYDHGIMAQRFLGYPPTTLTLEFYAAFLTASANETTTFVGMVAPSNVDAAAAGSAGAIRSGGTASTFFLTSDNGSDAGAAIDTNYHLWRIVYGPTTTEWFIDDVSQGTITTETDIWPLSFKAYSATTNRIALVYARIWYS